MVPSTLVYTGPKPDKEGEKRLLKHYFENFRLNLTGQYSSAFWILVKMQSLIPLQTSKSEFLGSPNLQIPRTIITGF